MWYNYTLASAGTITGTNNTTTATQSICPKGWTLPSEDQSRSIGNDTKTYISDFSPVLGGYYLNGTLNSESTLGLWWSSTASNGAGRYRLDYHGSSLYTVSGVRRVNGYYVRCVQAS
ncbi:hypothetical protein IJG93_01750 [Candidatus Saccharibacteria bacterium]|nr:hypothetical protein [Candidatus Saccharibacteria bacterium]